MHWTFLSINLLKITLNVWDFIPKLNQISTKFLSKLSVTPSSPCPPFSFHDYFKNRFILLRFHFPITNTPGRTIHWLHEPKSRKTKVFSLLNTKDSVNFTNFWANHNALRFHEFEKTCGISELLIKLGRISYKEFKSKER